MSGSFLLHGSLSRKRAVMYGYISLKTGDSVTTGHFPGSHAAHANSPQGGTIVAVTAEM
ncbi:hypothetical protein RA350_004459 [Salmonella enterica]|nr:hypothetical protein [Salmonella enterica]